MIKTYQKKWNMRFSFPLDKWQDRLYKTTEKANHIHKGEAFEFRERIGNWSRKAVVV